MAAAAACSKKIKLIPFGTPYCNLKKANDDPGRKGQRKSRALHKAEIVCHVGADQTCLVTYFFDLFNPTGPLVVGRWEVVSSVLTGENSFGEHGLLVNVQRRRCGTVVVWLRKALIK